MKKGALILSFICGLSLFQINNKVFAGENVDLNSKIKYLQNNNYVDKTKDLRLNDNITRAEFVKILVKNNYSSDIDSMYKNKKSNYKDVSENYWAKGYINYITSGGFNNGKKILNGYKDGTFKPDNNIKVSEMAKILSLYYGNFNENDIRKMNKNWPVSWMEYAKNSGILTDENINANSVVNRKQAFDAFYNVLNLNTINNSQDFYNFKNDLNSRIDYKSHVTRRISLNDYNLKDKKDFENFYKVFADAVSNYTETIELYNINKYISDKDSYENFINKYFSINELDHIFMYSVIRPISYKITFDGNTIKLYPYYMENIGNVQKSEDLMVNWVKENIKSTDRDIDKVIKIHDYIIEAFDYDMGKTVDIYKDGEYYGFDDKLNGFSVHSTTGLFLNKLGVCDAYALAFQRMAKLSGLDSVIIMGDIAHGLHDDVGDHSWNKVKVDGKWYNVDVVYNDPIKDKNDHSENIDRYTCCLISDKTISKNHKAIHDWYPKALQDYPRELLGE